MNESRAGSSRGDRTSSVLSASSDRSRRSIHPLAPSTETCTISSRIESKSGLASVTLIAHHLEKSLTDAGPKAPRNRRTSVAARLGDVDRRLLRQPLIDADKRHLAAARR